MKEEKEINNCNLKGAKNFNRNVNSRINFCLLSGDQKIRWVLKYKKLNTLLC